MKGYITHIVSLSGVTADVPLFHHTVRNDVILDDILQPHERTFCLQALAFQRSIAALAQFHRLGPWKFVKPDSITEGE